MRRILCGLVLVMACGTNNDAQDAPGDGPPGEPCGGLAGLKCGATEYCDFVNNRCGDGDQQGTCKPRPQACPLVIGPPICGCDGQVHTGECAAYVTGTDLNASGRCPLESTQFACGYAQCELAMQYCQHTRPASGPEVFACVSLPSTCAGGPSCGCLTGEPCGTRCTGDAQSGLTLTCP